MRTRIGTQIIVATGLTTALAIGALAVSSSRAHRAALVRQVDHSADQLAQTIKSATYHDMLENRRESLKRQLETIGRQPGIKGVRLFNKEGTIVLSSDPKEVGRSVDKRAEACYACHAENSPLAHLEVRERARTFTTADDHHVLGIIAPIENAKSCSTALCHEHDPQKKVLGVLDVTMSLDEVDQELATSQLRMLLFAAAALVASSVVLFLLNRRLIIRPVEDLVAATRRVAEGDLVTRVPATAAHELGDLGRSFNDMTARLTETQRQLTQADKLASVGQLAAGVAHEINNPLTGVLTYASFLLKRADDKPEMKEDLEVIVRETKRCREIVKGMLDFARKTPPKRLETSLNTIVERAVAIVTAQLALKRVTIDLDLAEGLPTLSADENQIQQVLVNLLLNAADSMGERGGGKVRVTTRRTAGKETLEALVEDEGAGISQENLKHLFEPFFSTKGARGTGLGLAVSWGILESHGGSIDVQSELGRGTCFTVRLPLAPTGDAREPSAQPVPSPPPRAPEAPEHPMEG
jgi:two-component system NtrC family sensor kinase